MAAPLIFTVEIPVNDNLLQTQVSLNDNSPSNSDLLPEYSTVDNIPGTSTGNNNNVLDLSNNELLPDYSTVDDIQEISQGDGSIFDLNNLPEIKTLAELLRYLTEVMIVFNTLPKYYTKDDYKVLIQTLSNSLIHLYTKEQEITDYERIIKFVGLANLTTNPSADAIALNNRFPGIYLADAIGFYPNFGVTITNDEKYESVILLIPEISSSNELTRYNKIINKLSIPINSYTYSSDTEKLVWVINHNLNKYPNVIIKDSVGYVYEGSIVYTDKNNLIITFSKPFNGYAELN